MGRTCWRPHTGGSDLGARSGCVGPALGEQKQIRGVEQISSSSRLIPSQEFISEGFRGIDTGASGNFPAHIQDVTLHPRLYKWVTLRIALCFQSWNCSGMWLLPKAWGSPAAAGADNLHWFGAPVAANKIPEKLHVGAGAPAMSSEGN